MKLALKIAAGILIAWGTILCFALVMGLLAGAAVTQATKPTMDKIQAGLIKPMQEAAAVSPTTPPNFSFRLERPTEEDQLIMRIQLCEKMNGQFINGKCQSR